MAIKRIVANFQSTQADLGRSFYVDFLGLDPAMDLGWVATYASPENPSSQVTIVRADEGASPQASLSIEVDDVDRVHTQAVARGVRVVYPLTDEPWGVRRFWVEGPDGVVINILSHRNPSSET